MNPMLDHGLVIATQPPTACSGSNCHDESPRVGLGESKIAPPERILIQPPGKGRARPSRQAAGKPQGRAFAHEFAGLRLAGTDAPYVYRWVCQDAPVERELFVIYFF